VKIRVLEVLASLRRAGAERVAVTLACGLDRTRFETAVVSLYPASEGDFEPALDARGVLLWRMGKRRGLDPRMWPRLAAAIRAKSLSIGLPPGLSNLGVDSSVFEEVIRKALIDHSNNTSPRKPTAQEFAELLRDSMS